MYVDIVYFLLFMLNRSRQFLPRFRHTRDFISEVESICIIYIRIEPFKGENSHGQRYSPLKDKKFIYTRLKSVYYVFVSLSSSDFF